MRTGGGTDTHDEANSRFSQFCEPPLKITFPPKHDKYYKDAARFVWCPVRATAMATAKRNYELNKLTITYLISVYPAQ